MFCATTLMVSACMQVTMQLLDKFHNASAVQIRCLAGGLISWFNDGHDLETENDAAVAALHPHTPELTQFILRDNDYQ
jgi:hypothetical protein